MVDFFVSNLEYRGHHFPRIEGSLFVSLFLRFFFLLFPPSLSLSLYRGAPVPVLFLAGLARVKFGGKKVQGKKKVFE